MPTHGHRVYIDVPRPRTPPTRSSSQRIQVVRTTTGASPRRSSFRRHSLVLDDDDRPVLSSTTTTTTSSSGAGTGGGGLFFRDDPSLAGAMSSPDTSAYTLRSGPPPSSTHHLLQVKDQTIRELHHRCDQLELENLDLRRSLDSSSSSEARRSAADVEAQLARSRKKRAELKVENEALRGRVREAVRLAKEAVDDRVRALKGEVGVLGRQVLEWRGRAEEAEKRAEAADRRAADAERRLDRLRENLDDYVAENERLRGRAEEGRRRRS
ncbi:hypothetical protein QBC39DRAFT_19766 [Podospora conica]|nr:hypothetical protein QBC39DRAFT_19766 [Schizothecium conicum]